LHTREQNRKDYSRDIRPVGLSHDQHVKVEPDG